MCFPRCSGRGKTAVTGDASTESCRGEKAEIFQEQVPGRDSICILAGSLDIPPRVHIMNKFAPAVGAGKVL